MLTNPTTSNVSCDIFALGRCSIRGLLDTAFGAMEGLYHRRPPDHRSNPVVCTGLYFRHVAVAGVLAAVRHLKASNVERVAQQEATATLKVPAFGPPGYGQAGPLGHTVRARPLPICSISVRNER